MEQESRMFIENTGVVTLFTLYAEKRIYKFNNFVMMTHKCTSLTQRQRCFRHSLVMTDNILQLFLPERLRNKYI
jgi:hypothetical protein